MTLEVQTGLRELSDNELELIAGGATTMQYAAGGLGGAVSGFGVGASLGALGGPVGAAIGGTIGFGVGAVGGFITAHYLAN